MHIYPWQWVFSPRGVAHRYKSSSTDLSNARDRSNHFPAIRTLFVVWRKLVLIMVTGLNADVQQYIIIIYINADSSAHKWPPQSVYYLRPWVVHIPCTTAECCWNRSSLTKQFVIVLGGFFTSNFHFKHRIKSTLKNLFIKQKKYTLITIFYQNSSLIHDYFFKCKI